MRDQPNPTTKIDNELTKLLTDYGTELLLLQDEYMDKNYDQKELDLIATYEKAIKTLILNTNNEARISEVDDLRREFWRTTWTPYDPDSIFKDRLQALKDKSKGEA